MNVAFAELEEASTAVYVTMVSPIEKVDPELWLDVKFTLPELSLVVGSDHVTIAVAEPTSVLWTLSDGIPLITGISTSMNKMLWKETLKIDLRIYLVQFKSSLSFPINLTL